jgi:hypothetical protein
MLNKTAGGVGFTNGIQFGNAGLAPRFPVISTGTLLYISSAGTVNYGIDFFNGSHNLTCTLFCFRSNGFSVDGSGNVVLAGETLTGCTTQGKVFYVSSTGAIACLGTGTQYQVLQTQGAGANPAWASPVAPPYAAATNGTFVVGTQYHQQLTGFSTVVQTSTGSGLLLGDAGTFGAVNGRVFRCQVTTAPGAGFTDTCALEYSGVAQSVTCDIVDTATSCTDASHTVAYTAGVGITMGFKANTGATAPGKVYTSIPFAYP